MCAYLGGSAIQTVGDNPVTAYHQLVQQFVQTPRPPRSRARAHRQTAGQGPGGQHREPKAAQAEVNAVFKANPVKASLSGLWPRLIGVLLKRVPKLHVLTCCETRGRI